MNRKIKFRGKTESNQFIFGDLIQYENGDTAIWEKEITGYGYEATQISNRTKVDKGTIGQFTGLLDKSGNDIYEGDIVKAPLLDPIFGKREHNIYLSDLYKRIEVIGNIFDNKELLED